MRILLRLSYIARLLYMRISTIILLTASMKMKMSPFNRCEGGSQE